MWATAADAQTPQRFDLICEGRDLTTGVEKPDRRRYTIDLAAKRWCRTDQCEQGIAIDAVSADLIQLTKPSEGSVYVDHYINRIKGTYVDAVKVGSSSSRAEGACKRAPFTGFPATKF